jgi:hypothetical protein
MVACQWNMSSATGPVTNPMKRSEYHLAFAVRKHYMARHMQNSTLSVHRNRNVNPMKVPMKKTLPHPLPRHTVAQTFGPSYPNSRNRPAVPCATPGTCTTAP